MGRGICADPKISTYGAPAAVQRGCRHVVDSPEEANRVTVLTVITVISYSSHLLFFILLVDPENAAI
jgi:hypothetical protein